MERIEELYQMVLNYPYLNYVVVAVVLVVVLFMLLSLRARLRRRPKEILAFESGTGNVTVARSAIADLIHRAAANTEGVAKCSSRITVRRGQLQIKLKLHLRASSRLKDVHQTLKNRIGETLKRTLGIEQMGDIDTVVVGLVGTPDTGSFVSSEDAPKALGPAYHLEAEESTEDKSDAYSETEKD